MEYFRRYRLHLLLIVLVGLNIYYFWPSKKSTQTGFPHPPGGMPPMGGQPSAEMEARIKALPEAQRTVVEQRLQQDKEFFASISSLSDSDKQQKIHDYMSKNPPPAGMFPGGPPGSKGGPGGPPPGGPGPGGPGDTPHIPPPDVRRDMDQHLVDAMKNSS